MTLRYLEIFLALARTPNMRDAAAKLFISQAAVSSALRDFEAELGVSLFDRMGRGIRLNDKGRLLEERLAPLYNQLKNVLALVASDELAGKIRIGASTTLSDFVLPQVLYNFKMRHHQVEIECESGNTADIVRHVEHGLLDVGFVEGDVHNLAVEITPLAKESLVIVTADKALAEAGPYPIEALLDRHWLLRERGKRFCASLPRAACARRSFWNSSTTTPSSRFSTIRVCSPASPRASCSGKSAPVNCSSSA
mgnify:CR=1 FL=1